MGSIKTIVSEITSVEDEARNMTFVIGMWGWGFLVSPAISGALAEPARQYPDTDWIQQSDLLQTFPFLMPNLLGSGMCLVAFCLTKLFVRETLPERERCSVTHDLQRWWRKCRGRTSPYQSLRVLKTHESDRELGTSSSSGAHDDDEAVEIYDTVAQEGVVKIKEKKVTSMSALMARPQTRKCLLIYWLYSFVGLTVDESFPLFCLSHKAGFGLPEKEIGKILSGGGMVFAVCQYFIYNTVYNRFGLYGSIKIGTALSAPVMFMVPLSLLLNRGAAVGELRWSTFCFLAAMLALYRCFALVFFSSISVATNRTVPISDRASINGLGVLGGSAAKALGPTFAGVLTTVTVKWLGKYASLVVFGTIGVLGMCVTVSSILLLHEEGPAIPDDADETQEESVQSIELLPHENNGDIIDNRV